MMYMCGYWLLATHPGEVVVRLVVPAYAVVHHLQHRRPRVDSLEDDIVASPPVRTLF